MSTPLTCTVGVLTAGRPDLLSTCLDSLRSARGMVPAEIIVCENSLDATAWESAENMCRRRRAPLWVCQEERSLAACWNFLVSGRWHDASASDRGQQVAVLLNDDIEVGDFWLDAIEHALRHNPDVGIVSLQQYRDVRARVAPQGARCAPLSAYTVGTGGYCFGFRVADWTAAGGFDEQFWRFYEDMDFGAAMTQLGRRNVDLREPRVYHRIGATMGTLGQAVNERNLAVSRAKFVRKWGERLGIEQSALDDGNDPTRRIAAELLRAFPDDKPKAVWTQELNEREAAGEMFELDATGDWYVLP